MKRLDYVRAVIAKWLIAHVAARIHPEASLSLCLQVARIYKEKIDSYDG